jgi:hypothetical protein
MAKTQRASSSDCFIVATTHVKGLAVVTRDNTLGALSVTLPDYLKVVPC